MSIPLSHHALHLNNVGAHCIQNGFYAKACTVLTQSLHLVRKSIANDVAMTSSSTSTVSNGPQQGQRELERDHGEGHHEMASNNNQQTPSHRHPKCTGALAGPTSLVEEEYYMHASPSMLPDDDGYLICAGPTQFLNQSNDDGFRFSISSVSTIVVSNLALACHLKATFNPDQGGGSISKAIRLYENAHRLHVQQLGEQQDIALPMRFLQRIMSILNNLSHLHQSMGNTEEAQQCNEQLLQSYFWLQQNQKEDEQQQQQLQQQMSLQQDSQFGDGAVMDGVLENVIGYAMKGSISAAAA